MNEQLATLILIIMIALSFIFLTLSFTLNRQVNYPDIVQEANQLKIGQYH